MDPRDRLRLRLVGTGCSACGSPYRAAGIRILAQRDDLAFVLLHCSDCGSEGLGLVTDGDSDAALALEEGAAGRRRLRGELSESDAARLSDAPPISSDDVLAVHEVLARHHGDLLSLLPPAGAGSGP